MTPSIEMAGGGRPDEPLGYLVMGDGSPERSVPIFDQLFVGRECAGISESRRLVIADPEISRTHLEIRLDAEGDQAFVIDTSTNGTLLNGMRLERAVPQPIRAGDEIRIGDMVLTFRSQRFTAASGIAPGLTRTRISRAAMVMVVGDIVNYSTISQVTDEQVIAQSLHTLWNQVGGVLRAHHGTLNHYAGDAIFAIWEASRFPMPLNGRSISRSPRIGLSRSSGPNCRCAARTARRSAWVGVWCGHGRTGSHDQIGRGGDRRLDQRGVPVGWARRAPRTGTGDGDQRRAPHRCGPLHVGRGRRR